MKSVCLDALMGGSQPPESVLKKGGGSKQGAKTGWGGGNVFFPFIQQSKQGKATSSTVPHPIFSPVFNHLLFRGIQGIDYVIVVIDLEALFSFTYLCICKLLNINAYHNIDPDCSASRCKRVVCFLSTSKALIQSTDRYINSYLK